MEAVSQSNEYDALAIDGNMDLPGGKRGALDYFIRDYQQNVRIVLTEETHFGANTATMETARAGAEEPIFGQAGAANEVAQTRFSVSSIPGQTTGGGWQNSSIGAQVSKLSALAGSRKAGPNALLKVMGGDVVSATTQYYYQQQATNTSGSTLVADVLGSLVQAIAGSPVTSLSAKGATSGISSQLDNTVSFKSLVAPDAADAASTLPKAYLTVLFFDERFNFVGESSTTMRVGGVPGPNASLTAANLKAPKNGYAYVYVSNESQEPVYFDNLQVAHTRGRIAEETHYYSYGLQIAAISSRKVADPRKGTLDNRYGYNDKELWDDADLNWLDYGFRNYDPQIGRFVQLDPLADDYAFLSPYLYAYDDPIANVDVDGLFGEGILSTTAATAKTLSGVTVTAVRSTATVVKAGGVFMNGLSTVISVSTRLISTAQNAVSILNTSTAVRQVGRGSGYSDPVQDLMRLGKDVYKDGILPAVDWINHNVNPVYGVYNGIQSQFTKRDFLNGQAMSRADGSAEVLWSVFPGGRLGKVGGVAAGAVEKAAAKGGWLKFHERVGHTLREHVGKADGALIARLKSSSRISGASSFANQEIAESVISSTIRTNKTAVNAWLRSGSTRNLVLPYSGTSVIGRGIMRGHSAVSDLTNARIVLKSNGSGGYNILTAFPK